MAVVILVVLVVAALAGLVAQRALFGRRGHDHPLARIEGLPLSDLVVPARTLASLVLAFVVVAVYGSYDDAERQAAAEAGAVLTMGEATLLLTPAARADVLGHLRCYTRAVVGPDWEAQNATGSGSVVADRAADGLGLALGRAATDPRNAAAVSAMLGATADRVQTRIDRIDDARRSLPDLVWVVLLVAMAVMIGGLTALGHPGTRLPAQVAVAAGTTLVFGLMLFAVYDLDRPYDGWARIEPTAMQNTERRLEALPQTPLVPPCGPIGA